GPGPVVRAPHRSEAEERGERRETGEAEDLTHRIWRMLWRTGLVRRRPEGNRSRAVARPSTSTARILPVEAEQSSGRSSDRAAITQGASTKPPVLSHEGHRATRQRTGDANGHESDDSLGRRTLRRR